MALLFFDSFDHYGNGVDPVAMGKWGSFPAGLPAQVQTGRGRTGVGSIRFLGSNYAVCTKNYTTSGGAVVGFALIGDTAWSLNFDLLQIREGSVVHMALAVNPGGLISVKRGATVLATGTSPLPLSAYTYIEFKCIIDDVNGSYETRIDGITEAALTNAGPVDTRNGGTGVWNNLFVGGAATTSNMDDLYLMDTSGAAPRNNFLGPVKVEMMLPQTDAVAAGSNAGLTPSTGTDHGALVDENGPNTSDYNSSPTVGLKDTYNFPNMAISGTVFGVQTNLYLQKSDATARQVCHVLRSGGTDFDGANISPTTAFVYNTLLWAQNPNGTIEWTTGDIATVQAGMKVTL